MAVFGGYNTELCSKTAYISESGACFKPLEYFLCLKQGGIMSLIFFKKY